MAVWPKEGEVGVRKRGQKKGEKEGISFNRKKEGESGSLC